MEILLFAALTTFFIADRINASGATVSCYHCDSHAGMACGLAAGWNIADLENSVKPCPDGFCYTYQSSDVFDTKKFEVKRGCGRLPCYELPYEGNVSALCDVDSSGHRKEKNVPLPSGPPFNQRYNFVSELRNRTWQTGRLQYCDTDRCNKDPTHFAVDAELSNATSKTYYCVNCRGPVNESCGILGASEERVPSDEYQCPSGYCFIYVFAESDRSVPKVWRGCGPVSCKYIPGSSDSIGLCDEADKLEPVDTSNGDPFSKIRTFSARYGPTGQMRAGTVQYCKTGTRCNYQSVRSFPLVSLYPNRSPTVQEVMDQLKSPKGPIHSNPGTGDSPVKQLFRIMDVNGDGVLDETEFSKSLSRLS
ncbi:uncharacterized protein LOC129592542 [Paramacrobiotus metropolitanus]|uniref:uncharacterized protein LOC129592542 n=1 Tax=Paramacrobiotus metropolitanus TaxID=2943436 RepID=UPI002445A0BB|nr:uncharacterized protein LOC129592542 [Paramacrobiotus metropolitanus]